MSLLIASFSWLRAAVAPEYGRSNQTPKAGPLHDDAQQLAPDDLMLAVLIDWEVRPRQCQIVASLL